MNGGGADERWADSRAADGYWVDSRVADGHGADSQGDGLLWKSLSSDVETSTYFGHGKRCTNSLSVPEFEKQFGIML